MTEHGSRSELAAEAEDLVDELSRTLSALDAELRAGRTPDPDLPDAAFRAVHTLKGLAGMFDVDPVHRLAHELESALAALRLGRIPLDPTTLDVLFDGADAFTRMLADHGAGAAFDLAPLLARIARLSSPHDEPVDEDDDDDPASARDLGLPAAMVDALTEYQEHRLRTSLEGGRSIVAIHVSFDLLALEVGLEAIKSTAKALGELVAFLPRSDAPDDHLDFDVLVASDQPWPAIVAAVADAGATVRDLTPRPPEPAAAPEPAAPEPAAPEPAAPRPSAPESLRDATATVKVDLSRLDHLMNLVGELGIVRSNLGGNLDVLRSRAGLHEPLRVLQTHLRTLSRQLALLQQGLLDVRMVPLEHVFDKLARAARKVGKERGKEVRLRITGESTELDKLIVNRLDEALLHLVRNAVDHGIEPRAARVAAGKPIVGTIDLRAFQRGNQVVVEMEDDGRGIDWRQIRDVAVQKGLVTPEKAATLGEAESIDLIYLRGLTTTTTVTTTSGRAFGMDVVRTKVAELSGTIDVDTVVGRGTRFSIMLPVTLAIIQALVVETGRQTFCIPLGAVRESIMVRRSDIATVEGHEVVSLRGRTLPLLHLAHLFELAEKPVYGDPDRIYVVIVGAAEQRVGLVIDALIDQRDVVLKPLGKALALVPGLAGATEIGGNRTVLLLDVATLVAEAISRSRAPADHAPPDA